jgi:hypothetical protein
MAGEHWNDGIDEPASSSSTAAAAVGDVRADELLRIEGFNLIGVSGSASGMGDDSPMSSWCPGVVP